jgi:hypothetical protein
MPGDDGSHFFNNQILKEEEDRARKLSLRNECKNSI